MTEKRAAGAFRLIPRRRCDGGGGRARGNGRARERAGSGSGTHVVEVFPSPPAMAPAATPGAPTRGRAVVRPSRRDAAAEVVPREEGSPGAAAARAARAEARRGASARATDEAAHAITVLPVRVGRSVALRSLVRSPRRAARLCGRRNDLTRLVESPPAGGRDETARALKSGTGKTGLPRDISSVTIAFRRARDVRQPRFRALHLPRRASTSSRVRPSRSMTSTDAPGAADAPTAPPPGDEAKPPSTLPDVPGIEGMSEEEVRAFLESLDEFTPTVRPEPRAVKPPTHPRAAPPRALPRHPRRARAHRPQPPPARARRQKNKRAPAHPPPSPSSPSLQIPDRSRTIT